MDIDTISTVLSSLTITGYCAMDYAHAVRLRLAARSLRRAESQLDRTVAACDARAARGVPGPISLHAHLKHYRPAFKEFTEKIYS